MMSWFDAILLGVLQGITEFLPVSSSGHLVVAQYLLKYKPGEQIFFNIMVHLGTLAAVMAVYRTSLLQYVSGIWSWRKVEGGLLTHLREDTNAREIALIILATVPTGLIGVLFRKQFDHLFGSPGGVALMFGVTGALLLSTRWVKGGDFSVAGMGWWRALIIGLVQGVAITPGISRSGSTIAFALLLGMRREEAARFSFLLSIPAILGAVVLESRKVTFANVAWGPILIGAIIAAAAGLLSLIVLLRFVRKGHLWSFTPYLWILSILLLWKLYG